MKREICVLAFLSACAVRDLRTMRVQREMLYMWGLAAVLLYTPETLGQALVRLGAGLLWLVGSWFSGGSVGEGDGWCLFLCSLTIGAWKTAQILLLASSAAAGTSLVIIRTGEGESRLPFIPFMAAAAWLVLVKEYLQPG